VHERHSRAARDLCAAEKARGAPPVHVFAQELHQPGRGPAECEAQQSRQNQAVQDLDPFAAVDARKASVQRDGGGPLRLMDGFSGSTISALSLGSAIQASPAAYGNQIVVGTTGGMLYFVELR